MIDFARIAVIAGNGGNGSGSFFRIKGKRYGKADGGDGGWGGDVYIEATGDLSTLEPYRYVKNYKAENGGNGFPNHRRGADGENLVLKVPVGTVVRLSGSQVVRSSGSIKPDSPVTRVPDNLSVFDLVENGQKVLVARGGEGGRGNAHLRDEFGRRPKFGESGQEGEQVQITLELKLLADVGIIGLPNAGKSTLLAKLTAARPKIAAYPFTTLEPNLGVLIVAGPVEGSSHPTSSTNSSLNVDSNSSVGLRALDGTPSALATRIIIADIPGLIEGASKGRGLGDLFLRHIERTKVLVHLVDVSRSHLAAQGETLKEQIWQGYQVVRGELKAYSKELAKKPEIVVLTKIDLVDGKTVEAVAAFFKKRRKKVIPISAETGEGLVELVSALVRVTAEATTFLTFLQGTAL